MGAAPGRRMVRVLLASVLVVTACSHADDKHLTASEHRELAELHEARAEAERAQFDPSQTREVVTRSPLYTVVVVDLATPLSSLVSTTTRPRSTLTS